MDTSINIYPTYPPRTGQRWPQTTTEESLTAEQVLKRLKESVKYQRLKESVKNQRLKESVENQRLKESVENPKRTSPDDKPLKKLPSEPSATRLLGGNPVKKKRGTII